METHYYLLKPAVGTKETGKAYPAVESYEGYDFNAPNSVHKIRFDEFPDFMPDIRFMVAKGAKLCDMMGQATINANGFLVSENLKSVFDKSSIIPHKYYPATIKDKELKHNFFWIHFVWNEGLSFVDFNQTSFNVTEFGRIIEPIKINSYEDLERKQKQLGVIKMIYAEKIVMKNPGLDLFSNPINLGIYINEKLKHHIESIKPTGVSIQENDNILFR